jgi:predicted RNA methylase
MLTKILRQSAIEAINSETHDRWHLDYHKLSRGFKERWVYTNENPPTSNFHATAGSFVVLFQKNLGVTNASLIELLSLVRLHTTDSTSRKRADVEFLSDEQYTQFFEFLWQSLLPIAPYSTREELENDIETVVNHIDDTYGHIFRTTIIMDALYTTATLHIPKSLFLNLRAVVYESGYIHSAGVGIYIRNVQKADDTALLNRLNRFLSKEQSHPIFLTPYADEFFAPYETEFPISVRNGLDGVRLQLRKHFISGKPLLDFLANLPAQLNNRVFVPRGFGHYEKERQASIQEANASTRCSLWFITDTTFTITGGHAVRRGNDVYLLVYAQYFMNDNQFITFKERKPGWYASVTLPHTLSISCVNVARPHFKTENPVILDPFCGSGTTLIDAALRIPGARVIGLDREPLLHGVIRDNLEFFSLGAPDVQKLIHDIAPIVSGLAGNDDSIPPLTTIVNAAPQLLARLTPATVRDATWNERFQFALALILQEMIISEKGLGANSSGTTIIKYISENGFSKDFFDRMNGSSFPLIFRVLVYAIWRSLALGTFSLRGEASDLYQVIKQELDHIIHEYKYLLTGLGRDATKDTLEADKLAMFREAIGLYSHTGMVDTQEVKRLQERTKFYQEKEFVFQDSGLSPGLHVVKVADSAPLLEGFRGKVDAIITDPPYGFNTVDGGLAEMRNLFGAIIPGCVDALKSNGQLILVLPAFARNGRQIPFFETRGALVRQIIAAGDKLGRRFKRIVETVPGPRDLFEMPMYWKSATVLERRILRFMLD